MIRAGDMMGQMTGRKVLAMLLGFFGLILVVNGIFLYFALNSFSGLSTENAYVKGLNFNQTIAQGRAQEMAGWQVSATVTNVGTSPEIILIVRITDPQGRPLDGLTLSGQLRRPTHAGKDLVLTFQGQGQGDYRTTVAPGALGQWDLRLAAQIDDAADYRWEKRLWLK
ncbi:MAG: FixH family protein [Rhodospirillaceae bacterium]|jgi:nitrogen fixation protein FixH|nr:FixH family protein [Rhodospirillaceae bacterium]MBT5079322.1 FixH family protein [Rhodospirillaceae bacterium]MBT5525798.1 FixH family protein [Rhodospirillaceae bacterium]MBT5880169.1 FixH family protein [Rhodospirillaceae bacterium]MBT6590769.1 FixH family protein [Rhodospirillaceae bacterium]